MFDFRLVSAFPIYFVFQHAIYFLTHFFLNCELLTLHVFFFDGGLVFLLRRFFSLQDFSCLVSVSLFILGLLLASRCSIIILFLALIVSGSSNPVSMYRASLGVLWGTISILFMMLSMILLILVCSLFVGYHTSLLYVIVGWIQQIMSSQIVLISMFFMLLFPAMNRMVWYAAYAFPFVDFMWSSRLFFVLSSSPRNL